MTVERKRWSNLSPECLFGCGPECKFGCRFNPEIQHSHTAIGSSPERRRAARVVGGLDPDEIIITEAIIVVRYSFPLRSPALMVHRARNWLGFTREAISEQIMERYADLYAEDPKNMWGYDLDELALRSMTLGDDGIYEIGVEI